MILRIFLSIFKGIVLLYCRTHLIEFIDFIVNLTLLLLFCQLHLLLICCFFKIELLLDAGLVDGNVVIEDLIDCIFEVVDDLVDFITLIVERKGEFEFILAKLMAYFTKKSLHLWMKVKYPILVISIVHLSTFSPDVHQSMIDNRPIFYICAELHHPSLD